MILTYCATLALPYLCTPTGESCLSFELSRRSPSVSKWFFDTLRLTHCASRFFDPGKAENRFSLLSVKQRWFPQRAVLRYPLQDRPALVFFSGCWYNIGSGYLIIM